MTDGEDLSVREMAKVPGFVLNEDDTISEALVDTLASFHTGVWLVSGHAGHDEAAPITDFYMTFGCGSPPAAARKAAAAAKGDGDVGPIAYWSVYPLVSADSCPNLSFIEESEDGREDLKNLFHDQFVKVYL